MVRFERVFCRDVQGFGAARMVLGNELQPVGVITLTMDFSMFATPWIHFH
jgi:hypothetical protein